MDCLGQWKLFTVKQRAISLQLKRHLFTTAWVLLFSGCLTGCGTSPAHIPVIDKRHPERKEHGYHRVKSGETLHSIAWRYGRDFRELSTINDLQSPYTIYPGQRLSLRQTAEQPSIKYAQKKVKSKRYQIVPLHEKDYIGRKSKNWLWPAKGELITRYQANSIKNKGIDISGRMGEPVSASAAGKVVYSGSGLRGYGQLIIIKHNDELLSAYAHNSKLLVNEGDIVKVGQKIAEMGRSDAKSTKLHFEIRRNGKPVNPLVYLAKR